MFINVPIGWNDMEMIYRMGNGNGVGPTVVDHFTIYNGFYVFFNGSII